VCLGRSNRSQRYIENPATRNNERVFSGRQFIGLIVIVTIARQPAISREQDATVAQSADQQLQNASVFPLSGRALATS
jgi:hypothetical protein